MKSLVFTIWILIGLVSCKNSQDIDNQKDKNLFDLSKYRSVLYRNKVFTPEAGIELIDSIHQLHEKLRNQQADFFSNFRTLDSSTIVRVFQDSIDYYQKGIPASGSFSFHFNSLIFETGDYSGISIDRIAYDCWMTRYAAFLLIYNKGKLIGIRKIVEGTQTMNGIDLAKQTRSKLLNDTTFLLESFNWRFEEEKKINQIDTLAQLVTFGLSGKFKNDTLYFATKPFKKIHFVKEKNPKTGITETKGFLFFKDK